MENLMISKALIVDSVDDVAHVKIGRIHFRAIASRLNKQYSHMIVMSSFNIQQISGSYKHIRSITEVTSSRMSV